MKKKNNISYFIRRMDREHERTIDEKQDLNSCLRTPE